MVLEPGLISPSQYIKVLELVFEEAAVSRQTRNSRFEEEKEKKHHPNPSVCNSVLWGSLRDLLFQPVCWCGSGAFVISQILLLQLPPDTGLGGR